MTTLYCLIRRLACFNVFNRSGDFASTPTLLVINWPDTEILQLKCCLWPAARSAVMLEIKLKFKKNPE